MNPLLLALPLLASAGGVPHQLHYQGYLTDGESEPVHCPAPADCDDGPYDFVFRLYAESEGGTPLWNESHDEVPIDLGTFDVVLGAKVPVDPAKLPEELWLGVEVNGQGEFAPRQAVVSAAFALRAETAALAMTSADASKLGGKEASEYATVAGVPAICVTDDELLDALAAHAGDPDAHHSSTSDGLEITPSTVETGLVQIGDGSTILVEGELDLGPEVDDTLTAAIVKTLTGGGDADALHTHAGAGGGGACYTAWGTDDCAEGFTATSKGAVAFFSGTAETFCLDSAFPYSLIDDNSIVPWKIGFIGLEKKWVVPDGDNLPCVVCCK